MVAEPSWPPQGFDPVRLLLKGPENKMGTNIFQNWSANCEGQSIQHSAFVIRHSPRRLHALLEMRHQIGGDERDAFRIAHQRRGKCECRSAKSEVQSIRHLKFVIRHFPGRPRVRVRLLDGRAGEADERRIGHGITQVAGEAAGHLAGLFIHLAAKPILAAVRFIGEAGGSSTGREMRPVADRIAQLPEPFEGGVFDDGFVEAHEQKPAWVQAGDFVQRGSGSIEHWTLPSGNPLPPGRTNLENNVVRRVTFSGLLECGQKCRSVPGTGRDPNGLPVAPLRKAVEGVLERG